MKRKLLGQKKKHLFTKRFYPAGNYTWSVPPGCIEVDVFIVGGGGGGNNGSGGGSGYTKTYKKATTGWRDGDAIKVTPGQSVSIVVGKGGKGTYTDYAENGGVSQFMSSSYFAPGGNPAGNGYSGGGAPGGYTGGNGGSGGAPDVPANGAPGTDGGNGIGAISPGIPTAGSPGKGQGHTTRDFGEPTGMRNAGGGAANRGVSTRGGISDYTEGSGEGGPKGGGGYGGGGGGDNAKGGDGTVLIRYWAYTE